MRIDQDQLADNNFRARMGSITYLGRPSLFDKSIVNDVDNFDNLLLAQPNCVNEIVFD